MIETLVSVLALIAAVAVAYLLTVIDSIVHQQLYQFGLQFSYDWANPYWMLLRMSLALSVLISGAASLNIAVFFWRRLRSKTVITAQEEVKAGAAPSVAALPTLFQCSSCGRSITHPLRMLDFHSNRPKMINVCPFCNATVIPSSYAYAQKEVKPAEKEGKGEITKVNKSFGV